jgi:hypothetical protein
MRLKKIIKIRGMFEGQMMEVDTQDYCIGVIEEGCKRG